MTTPARRRLGLALAAVLLVVACSGGDGEGGDARPGDRDRPDAPVGPSDEERAASGGDATVENTGAQAFAQAVPGLDTDGRRFFAVGNNFFNDNWVIAPASTDGRDGLGPLFNAQSCSSCHFRDGRGQPPADADDPERGLLIRLSVADGESTAPHPVLGEQLQDRAIPDVPVEGSVSITYTEEEGTYDDGTPYTLAVPTYTLVDAEGRPLGDDVLFSPRVAPPMFGVGLLELVPAEDIIAEADPDDADGDGVSGRPALVDDVDPGSEAERAGERDGRLGRFGWKALEPTVEDQTAAAFRADIGVTTDLRPEQPCTAAQPACLAAPTGGEPEVDEQKLGRVTFYSRTLAVPARRHVGEPATDRGEELFAATGCASCHLTEMRTGSSDVAEALSEQVIRPYTDLLLHDMGPGLADGRPEGAADGSEWRTPPLWGIGLTETVNGHTRFLHDGRARSLEEAVLWHGGEAAGAQERFRALSADDRRALLTFLESL
ncbi:c-type cytochrome [Iamia sp. SCSIO 61187]|uniref:di-heme oxidoreductase family protein n=1 Tax=Iamia sp. SCSIO 61187 TaxID=2722752 RepID=UPI001C62F121|nr:di-heme oxidoredictase family protein [Iamia sp. SCSIO 61187]QYG95427.1 c-type cytochrome [Iamia sp. SCSIO 61187]